MSKLMKNINPNVYLKLSTYAKNYGVCKKKLYRYVDDDLVENIKIDGIRFIKDVHFPNLERDNRERIVSSVTIDSINVPTMTIELPEMSDNELDDDYVPTETLEIDNVPTMTLQKRLNELLEIPENDRTIKEFEEITEINEKI